MRQRFWVGPRRGARAGAAVVLGATVIVLAGCGGGTVPDQSLHTLVTQPPWETKESKMATGSGSFFGGLARGAQDNKGGQGIGVNAYLWRGTLDTLSFMPLASADPFGGVIITDWYTSPSAPSERFKADVYILGRELRADGIKVTVFRQVLQSGQWIDAPVDPSTASEIENKVLAKARELRAHSASLQ